MERSCNHMTHHGAEKSESSASALRVVSAIVLGVPNLGVSYSSFLATDLNSTRPRGGSGEMDELQESTEVAPVQDTQRVHSTEDTC